MAREIKRCVVEECDHEQTYSSDKCKCCVREAEGDPDAYYDFDKPGYKQAYRDGEQYMLDRVTEAIGLDWREKDMLRKALCSRYGGW